MSRQSYDLKTVADGVKYKVQATATGWEKSEFSAEVGKGTIPVANGKIGENNKEDIIAAVDGNIFYVLSSNSNFNSCKILMDCTI